DEIANGGPTNMHIINNDISTDARCNGVMLVVHGTLETGLLFENNRITTTSTSVNCYGIFLSGSAVVGAFQSPIIRRNRVTVNTTTASGIEVDCDPNALVSDNLVLNCGINIGYDGANAGCTAGYVTTAVIAQNNSLYAGTLLVASSNTA